MCVFVDVSAAFVAYDLGLQFEAPSGRYGVDSGWYIWCLLMRLGVPMLDAFTQSAWELSILGFELVGT